ncbi:MAG TPA: hypothetical protein VF267_05430 [Gammaproteobacteria bacterium]
MKYLFAMAIASMMPGLAAADETEDQIAQYDKDGDGALSRQEITADPKLSARFQELDVNADGLLDEDELDSGFFDDFDEMGEDPIDE